MSVRVRGSRLYLPARWSWRVHCTSPVIVHDRDAHADSMEITRRYPDVIGVYHCYAGHVEMARELLKLGYLSVVHRCYHVQKCQKGEGSHSRSAD